MPFPTLKTLSKYSCYRYGLYIYYITNIRKRKACEYFSVFFSAFYNFSSDNNTEDLPAKDLRAEARFFFLSAVPMNFGRWLKIYFRSFFVKASLYYCRICRLFVSTLICEFLFGTQPNQRTGLKELPYMLFGLIESIFCRKTTFAKKMISFNFFFYWNITAIFGSKIWENIPSELNQRLIGASS